MLDLEKINIPKTNLSQSPCYHLCNKENFKVH